MKAFCCSSGGKDSVLSLYRALQNPEIEVTHLLNMINEDGLRSRSHGIGVELLKLQASCFGIPIIQRKTTWDTYEQEFKNAVLGLKNEGVSSGIFGDIDLQAHRDWVEAICSQMNIAPILPLWKGEREGLINEFINVGFKAIVVATNSERLGKEWLGRQIDKEFIANLKALGNIDLCGEDGEYHTFVYDGPIFKKPVDFIMGNKVLKDKHWFLQLKSIS